MNNLLYLYGIVQADTEELDSVLPFKGIDDQHYVFKKEYGRLAAIVCELNEQEYGEEQINKKTQNMEWVQEKAFHHHEALLKLHAHSTVIPMKFCTIYQSEDSLRSLIEAKEDTLHQLLSQLKGKEEWNLKIYCVRDKLFEKVAEDNLTIEEKRKEIAGMSKGRKYLETKKLDNLIEQEVEKELTDFSRGFHNLISQYSNQEEIKKNWNKDVTGKSEEMCWNCAYLLPMEQVEPFLKEITKANEENGEAGWNFEATGPWPAYHFVNLS
ncbi:GvpL/GvpF family gas vesicle protein [Halobacillus salinarum]|uniref:GvpL/GvpF family gas vesicle protein n=1 Tax=Halobacillus salinarum TaxID=2932257 RepID=A0ABY4EJ77_9BACI|nr:GvpL/GvpF family gas vesicle protein [Halobacillus salinarum]UOQ44146.1 GvpL/GvpF family gas vesicle protein [Halobacillus salinarum]